MIAIATAFLLLVGQDAPDLERPLKAVTADLLQEHVRVLASDFYEGRAAGFEGADKAAAYLEAEYIKHGIEPAGTQNYFQPFTFKRGQVEYSTRNVLGLWRGSDPALAQELVVLGAHYDHVGKRGMPVLGQSRRNEIPGDDVWNGADDNASGSACVLVVARCFAKSNVRPKRSILFALWGAEEAGLLGSKHWCQNPTWTIERVTFNLNLDMVGRNPDRPYDLEGLRTAQGDDIKSVAEDACRKERIRFTPYDFNNEAMFRSDGASFLRKSIPAVMFFSFWHPDYHNNGDHWDKLAYDRMESLSRACFRIVLAVSDMPKVPKFNPETPLQARYRPFGFEFEEVADVKALGLDETRAALQVTRVIQGTPAEKAGLATRDIVISFDGKPFSAKNARESVKGATLRVSPGKEYGLEILRGGQPRTLKIVWEK